MSFLMNAAVRLYLRRFDEEVHLMRHHPMKLQQKVLEQISRSPLIKALNTNISTGNNLSHWILDQPINLYESYDDEIESLKQSKHIRCKYYAQSSGTTTGVIKHIPTPELFLRANHLRGSWYNLHTLHTHDENIDVFNSKNLLIGGSIYEYKDKYMIGDVSGIMINRIPSFFRPYYVPSVATATTPDWERKIELTAEEAIKTNKVSLTGGVPTWVLTLFRLILQKSKANELSQLWPNLKAYLHGGVSIEPYRDEFMRITGQPDLRYIEIYNATEGFFAYEDVPMGDGMLLMTGAGVYYEFVEKRLYEPNVSSDHIMSIADVQSDTDYVMLITTLSGLVRYCLGDVIRFVSIRPPRIKVVGRISDYLNAFGEDLSLEHAESALLHALSEHHASVMHYTVAPRFITNDQKGRHEWYIEFDQRPHDLDAFSISLDQAVQDTNSNYAQKRSDSIALDPLIVQEVPKGAFKKYIQRRGKVTGQSKVKKLCNDRSIVETLSQLIGQ